MPEFRDYTYPSCNNKTEIHVRRCTPDGPVRGVVQIAHGIAEHVERYDRFAAFLAENGFVVVANDHLGHGQSMKDPADQGFFAENGGWEVVVGDMRRLCRLTSDEFPGLPYFLFGHSMGSFLSRTFIIRFPELLDGVILSGTGQQLPAVVTGGRLVSSLEIRRHGRRYVSDRLDKLAFGSYNKAFAPARTPYDWLSRDTEQVDKYAADPLCGFKATAGLFSDMMGGIRFVSDPKNLPRMRKELPVFFLSGDKDPVGDQGKGVLRAYNGFLKAGMKDVTLKLYPGGRHEMLNELNYQEVQQDVLVWLESKLPAVIKT
ncbi:MAG: lysophospholipase [Oscillospiraceae bacterium]